ncbi:uncharacterized protein LOC111623350 isoform X2 [Centruroides sculpturatus]|uniref:uncharacterized protein LOC111623350 isoform X2 n=1 Tax=Centruroides sculpturatus TaxID=218467 RepID=UPI000C6D0DC7|nr:uncharacterized protein LOC111623350 isoform X2 [Centruroides sculpturatus]
MSQLEDTYRVVGYAFGFWQQKKTEGVFRKMYYPSSFPSVRTFDPRHNSMGGPVDVPLLTPGREREIPLDLSLKTVRQTPESTAEFLMEHRKLLGFVTSQSFNNLGRQMPPNNVGAEPFFDRPLFRVPYRAADHSVGVLPPMTSQYCVDNRTVASNAANSLGSHHPMMSNLLQHEHQRVTKPMRNQSQPVPYVDPMTTLPIHPAQNFNGDIKRPVYNQQGLTNNVLPSYTLFPDMSGMDPSKDKMHHHHSAGRVNGVNGYDHAHYTDHLQRFCDQQPQQVARPVQQQVPQHVATATHYGYCMQNTPCMPTKDNRSKTTVNNYRYPAVDPRSSEYCLPQNNYCVPPTCAENKNVTQLGPTNWTSGLSAVPPTKVVAPASSPVLKRKEGAGGNQKESPRTARDFPGLPISDKNRQVSSNSQEIRARYGGLDEINIEARNDDDDVIVIEEDSSNNSVFTAAWKQVMAELDDRQKYPLDHDDSWRTIKRTAVETEPTAPPCLEAVRPDESRMPVDVYNSVSSPLGPPQLIAAVSSAPASEPTRISIPPPKPLIEELTLDGAPQTSQNSEPLFPRNDGFDSSFPLPPTFSDLDDLSAVFRLKSPAPPSTTSAEDPKCREECFPTEVPTPVNADKHEERRESNVLKKLLTSTPSCDTNAAANFRVSTPASTEAGGEGDKLEALSDCSRDSSKPGRKRSMLECLADSEGYVAEKKRSKTTDLFADPSQLGREERALQRAMLRFEKLEKEQNIHHSPSRPKCNKTMKSKEVMALEADETAFPRDAAGRRTYNKSAFVDFKPEVLSSRTRNQSAAHKYANHTKKYNKNAAYEEELRREAKRLAGFRAKRKLRKRLLARLYKEKTSLHKEQQQQQTDEEEKERKPKQERPVLSQLNLQWRPYKCRRRHFRSGLDMINRGKKKIKSSGEQQRRRLQLLKNRRNRLLLLDKERKTASETGGVPPDLKRLMVNKALGETVLHRAARLGYSEVVLYCLETNYCEVNARDNAGYTPLHECCSRGHVNISRSLLQFGADVNASAAGGIRPIHDAVENDHIEVVRLLLSFGADPTIATYSGMTPLKLTHSNIMKEFLRGYIADNSGEYDKHPVLPWIFYGSVSSLDPPENGYCIFESVPSDNEADENEDDFLFEISDKPHLPTFRIHLSGTAGKVPHNYLRLSDVLKQTGLTIEEFRRVHSHIEIVSVTKTEFETSSLSSQLLTGSSKPPVEEPGSTVSVVKLDNNIREVLGIETVTLR